MITIREENPSDYGKIAAINEAAFGQMDEALLVKRLRDDGAAAASLIAEEAGEAVGHVLLSWMIAERDGQPLSALALAPLAVLPRMQHRGIGSRLVEAAIDAGKCCGAEAMIVLGDPRYYPRFGFSAELGAKLSAPFSGPAFMALELAENSLFGSKVKLAYPPAFGL